MKPAYIIATAAHFPGPPIDNEQIDRYVAPIDARCARIKRRILAENGIRTRHYALDASGASTESVAGMAACALRAALAQACQAQALDFLAAASTGPDVSVPGFANMVQGEAALPPLKTASLAGVCASSISALDYAVHEIGAGAARTAAVVASEFPSRLFKHTRMRRARDLSFDAHFLRWMLSDAAAAWILADRPADGAPSLRVDFIHLKSFSGDYPTCMQVGRAPGEGGKAYLDYDDLGEAERDGAYFLRQDVRLLPALFDVAIHEYGELVRRGVVAPGAVDHFLPHYSSMRFEPVVGELMRKAGLEIPGERWYSNLARRGNVGAASIMTMLDDCLRERVLRPGERLLLFVPESGRFTVGFVGLTVVDPAHDGAEAQRRAVRAPPIHLPADSMEAPASQAEATPATARLIQDLMHVWHGYRSEALRSELAQRIFSGRLARADYVAWMAGWIGQVREGSRWMRRAADSLPAALAPLARLVEGHADEEQHDWRVLFDDYRKAGGPAAHADDLRRNAGAEALNAYLHRQAAGEHAAALLGAVYIIEGTGNRIVPALLPKVKRALGEGLGAYRFLEYHAEHDLAHIRRWVTAVDMALAHDPALGARMLAVAGDVATLYAMSWRHALDPQ